MNEENTKTQEGKTKKCFVIMPISDVEGYPKGHFDRVFKHVIVPACKKTGYEAIRADGTSKANVIIVDILKNALDCEMAICDLSARNPNVFYELGFRQAFDKKTVLMIDDKTNRPFDISAIRSFTYDSSLRIDLVDKAISDLVKTLQETQSMTESENNSLLKLLAIESPAILPKRKVISEDSSLILQAIHDLSDDIQKNLPKSKRPFHSNIINSILLKGQIVKVGNLLFDEKNKKDIGYVVDITDNTIVVRNQDGMVSFISLNSPETDNYKVMPF